jgi:metal-responsive CopG/Arc/MetJ family transcriptional regulator
LPSLLYLVILSHVKTAISLPDDIFDRSEKQAAELGISRSEFFARAAKRYLDELDSASITAQINAAIDAGAVDKDLEQDVIEHGRRFMLSTAPDEEW